LTASTKLAHLRKKQLANLFELLQQLLWCIGTPNSWTTLIDKNKAFCYQPQNGPFLLNYFERLILVTLTAKPVLALKPGRLSSPPLKMSMLNCTIVKLLGHYL
jgi:hypothetical protein